MAVPIIPRVIRGRLHFHIAEVLFPTFTEAACVTITRISRAELTLNGEVQLFRLEGISRPGWILKAPSDMMSHVKSMGG